MRNIFSSPFLANVLTLVVKRPTLGVDGALYRWLNMVHVGFEWLHVNRSGFNCPTP